MKIPFYKPSLGPEEINEVVDTLRSGWLTTDSSLRAVTSTCWDWPA